MTGHEPVGDRWTSISDGVPRRWYRNVPAPDRTDLRIVDSLRSINHRLADRWPAARIEPLLDFDRRYRGRDRSIATMDFAAEGVGGSFQYVDRTPVGAGTGELADLLEAAGEPAELVAELRADADAEGSD